jgi:hypothetical protein
MDAVTYPDSGVSSFINEKLVPLRVPFNHEPLSKQFQVKWTPTLVIADEKGNEHHRTVGFLAPEDLIPSLLLGKAKTEFDLDQFPGAIGTLEIILNKHRKSGSAPEAIYLYGVNRYKNTHDPKPLKEAYEELKAEYPESEWTKRAYPYRLL